VSQAGGRRRCSWWRCSYSGSRSPPVGFQVLQRPSIRVRDRRAARHLVDVTRIRLNRFVGVPLCLGAVWRTAHADEPRVATADYHRGGVLHRRAVAVAGPDDAPKAMADHRIPRCRRGRVRGHHQSGTKCAHYGGCSRCFSCSASSRCPRRSPCCGPQRKPVRSANRRKRPEITRRVADFCVCPLQTSSEFVPDGA
jgi:hypothetical protein